MVPSRPTLPQICALWVRRWVGAQRGPVLKDYGNPAGKEAAPSLGLQEALTSA